jgi:hypothetical protein
MVSPSIATRAPGSRANVEVSLGKSSTCRNSQTVAGSGEWGSTYIRENSSMVGGALAVQPASAGSGAISGLPPVPAK